MAEHVKATRPRTVVPRTPHRAPPLSRMAPALQAQRTHVRGTLGHHADHPAPMIQAKLRVGAVDDPQEHEADRVADRVMRMPEPAVQRACCAGGASGGTCADEVQREAAPGPILPHGGHVDASLVSSLGPGRPLPTAERAFFEPRFDADFSAVRIHDDNSAGRAARALGARAFTLGRDIAFAPGERSPGTPGGDRLMAHELAHVLQQSQAGEASSTGALDTAAHESEAGRAATHVDSPARDVPALSRIGGSAVVQMDEEKKAQPSGEQAGAVLTVVIRAPDDKFTQNVTHYARKTLGDPNVIEVDNLDEVFAHLKTIKQAGGPKLKSIRLVAHGSNVGGIKMKVSGESKRRFVSPQELEKMAENKSFRSIASGVMAADATVEFWGCYVGREVTSQAALSTMFQSEFRSLEGELKTLQETFEAGGKTITSSAQVDEAAKRNKHAKPQFEAWLLKQYEQLVANGDITPQATREDRIKVMREIFDRSGGKIQQLLIQEGRETVRRSDKDKWMRKWRKWNVK
jgi:hypothetical protein